MVIHQTIPYMPFQNDDLHIRKMDQQEMAPRLVQQSNYQNTNLHVNGTALLNSESIYRGFPVISPNVYVASLRYILFLHRYLFDFASVCHDNILTSSHLAHSVGAINQYTNLLVNRAFFHNIDVIALTSVLKFLLCFCFSSPQSKLALKTHYLVGRNTIDNSVQKLFASL